MSDPVAAILGVIVAVVVFVALCVTVGLAMWFLVTLAWGLRW